MSTSLIPHSTSPEPLGPQAATDLSSHNIHYDSNSDPSPQRAQFKPSPGGEIISIQTGVITARLATGQEVERHQAFEDHLRALGRSRHTLVAYDCDWRKIGLWSATANGEPFDLGRLVGREVAELRAHLLSRRQAPATINRALIFLAEYARWAAARGDARAALPAEVAAVAAVPQQPLAPKGLSKPELRRFLKEVDVRGNARDRALIYTLLFTGLRLSEAAGTEMADLAISERKGMIRLRAEVAKGGKQRDVPIPAQGRAVIAAYLEERGDRPGRVFLGERGPLGRNGITSVVTRYAEAARVPLSPHTLRHVYAYRFLETTGDLVGLADLLGHSNLNTTRLYTRKRMEDLEAAVDGLQFA